MMNQDIFVLVPGILGSVLQKDGRDVFGVTAGAGFRALFSAGESINDLKLDGPVWTPAEPGDETILPVPDLGDGITAARLAADAHLVPGLWKVDGYDRFDAFLIKRFGLVPGENYFRYAYDFRQDNRAAAHRLAANCRLWLAARRQQYPEAKVVLVAHSMGGLVSRYYLEVLGGWRDTRRLITLGTPFRGSLKAVDFVANGFIKAFGLIDLTDLLCSFTSVHQLLTTYRCVFAGDGEPARLVETPEVLPRLTPDQVKAARGFHEEIDAAVARHRQDDEYLAHRYDLHAVIGIGQPTLQSARWRDGRLEMLRSYNGTDLGGDGTVPRVSASPPEAKSDEAGMFSSDKHASLQNAEGVRTQMRGWINQIDLGEFLAPAPATVAVDADDVYRNGEPVRVRLTPSGPVRTLLVSLDWVGGPHEPNTPLDPVSLTWAEHATDVEFTPKEPGVYRVQVEGEEIEPVADLIVVAPS